MTSEPLVIQQVHLPQLELFCCALAETLRARLGPERAVDALRSSVSAECVQCGILLAGADVCTLAQPPTPEPHPKMQRLRLGDCARQGCDSYSYRFTFQAFPGIDWPELFPVVERLREELAQPSAPGGESRALHRFVPKLLCRVPVRAWAALAVVVVLLLLRHWHQGGAIPLIRQPEKFQVAPASEGAATHTDHPPVNQ